MHAGRSGTWAALVLFVGGVAYAAAVAIGILAYGLDRPIGDPMLAVMEILTTGLAPMTIVMMAGVHVQAPAAWKANSLIAVGFAVLLTGVTMSVHFVPLTALRQVGSAGLAWPSPWYAAELLAWDVFLGLSVLFAAPVFRGDGLPNATRRTMQACGTMCIIGVVGPATGDMRFQFIATAGYGLVLPAACLLLALLFRRESRRPGTLQRPARAASAPSRERGQKR